MTFRFDLRFTSFILVEEQKSLSCYLIHAALCLAVDLKLGKCHLTCPFRFCVKSLKSGLTTFI